MTQAEAQSRHALDSAHTMAVSRMDYLEVARDGCLCWQLSFSTKPVHSNRDVTGTRPEYNDNVMIVLMSMACHVVEHSERHWYTQSTMTVNHPLSSHPSPYESMGKNVNV